MAATKTVTTFIALPVSVLFNAGDISCYEIKLDKNKNTQASE